ncbi:NADH:flavorubredoxin reductase NorW [Photobacterium minamisatsumaniensis]|uniref:NADH:flavorubredoxin reductase NorW n=1 Tax=Photobacterium minamisatsumaniensis TaxID=2910233 RepID=UPI003D096BC1
MTAPVIIIGSGFAAYQLVKAIRRNNSQLPIHVFTADDGHDYNKPDLSHVVSKQQLAGDLIRLCGESMAESQNFVLHANTTVDEINTENRTISANGQCYSYSKLVLATGASTFVPKMAGSAVEAVITLNSLKEYESRQDELHLAKRVMVIGGGLIGTELAMDLASSGKHVVIVDPCESLMANMLPESISYQLAKKMRQQGTEIVLNSTVTELNAIPDQKGLLATLSSGRDMKIDCVISAAGLVPNVALAHQAGINVNRGVVVDSTLQTSAPDIYAIGDCAEINGKVMAYLQPALLSANALAKTLLGSETELVLPSMMVKIKTPLYPMQLGGRAVEGVQRWQVDIDEAGSTVQSFGKEDVLAGFVVTQEHVKQAFPLLKELSAN